jgi:ABC-type lipoprotein export system ATPase subunit
LNKEGGITVIMVTHDQDIARNADRIIALRDGRLVADTTDIDQAVQILHSSGADHLEDDSGPAQEENLD